MASGLGCLIKRIGSFANTKTEITYSNTVDFNEGCGYSWGFNNANLFLMDGLQFFNVFIT